MPARAENARARNERRLTRKTPFIPVFFCWNVLRLTGSTSTRVPLDREVKSKAGGLHQVFGITLALDFNFSCGTFNLGKV